MLLKQNMVQALFRGTFSPTQLGQGDVIPCPNLDITASLDQYPVGSSFCQYSRSIHRFALYLHQTNHNG